MEKIVVLTGSFNPISVAHRVIMESAVNKVDAKYGLFVETNDKYLRKKLLVDSKKPSSFRLSEEVRKSMIDSLSEEFPKLRFGGVELGGESSNTLGTLKKISKEYKGYKIYFIIGADKLSSVTHWNDFGTLFSNFGLIVFPRDGYDVNEMIRKDSGLTIIKDDIVVMNDNEDINDISSTCIREKFFKGIDYSMYMDKGPYSILSKYSPNDFPPVTDEDILQAMIEVGGRFGGNAARMKVYKDNKNIFNNWDPSIFGDRKAFLSGTKVYSKPIHIGNITKNSETLFDCVNRDCADVAEEFVNEGLKTAILNLASNVSPCGGYHKGSQAQEESLAYMSTLSQSLYQFGDLKYKHIRDANVPNYDTVYPMDINYGGIYTPNVTFFRNNIEKYYSLRDKTFTCNIITVASLANRERSEYTFDENVYFNSDGTLNKEGLEIESNKIRTIFRIALDNKIDCLVLGAFGCGVYKLLPEEVSVLFKNILNEPEFRNTFKKVVFAIYEGKGSNRKVVGREGKFAPFYTQFGK